MKSARNQILGIAVVIVGTIIWYRDSLDELSVGIVYLLLALLLGFSCLFITVRARTRLADKVPSPSTWLLRTRIKIAVISAWQFLMLGLFDVWSNRDSLELSKFAVSNLAIVFCAYNWDRLIVVADNPDQDGGSQPLKFFGAPSSRRLFFLLLLLYPLSGFVLGGMMLFIRGEPYPSPFHPPQLCLTFDLMLSIGAAVLIHQRYRSASLKWTDSSLFALGTVAVCAAAIGLQLLMSFSGYISALSGVVALCVGSCFHALWKASNSSAAFLRPK